MSATPLRSAADATSIEEGKRPAAHAGVVAPRGQRADHRSGVPVAEPQVGRGHISARLRTKKMHIDSI